MRTSLCFKIPKICRWEANLTISKREDRYKNEFASMNRLARRSSKTWKEESSTQYAWSSSTIYHFQKTPNAISDLACPEKLIRDRRPGDMDSSSVRRLWTRDREGSRPRCYDDIGPRRLATDGTQSQNMRRGTARKISEKQTSTRGY